MKTARQQNRKLDKEKKNCRVVIGRTGVQKSTSRTTQCNQKARGKNEKLRVENYMHSSATNLMRSEATQNRDCPPEETTKLPVLELHHGQEFFSSTKLKLQLFPIDEGTRIGLEKDGHHPYLELFVSTRKKISSVIKHLTSKWGSSSIAHGEPMIFPYNRGGSLSSCIRWTLNDYSITAGDVYAATGSPSNFRLRYGWFSTLTPFEGTRKGYSICMDDPPVGKQIEVTSADLKPIDASVATNTSVIEKIYDKPVDSVDDKPVMDRRLEKGSLLDADSLTSISIGALLSAASLRGKFDSWDQKVLGSNTGSRPAELISDSLNAFDASGINCPQGARLSSHELHSSILDAEETCHAFSISKNSSSSRNVLALDCGAGGCSQDAGSKSFKFPKTTEEYRQAEGPKAHTCKQSKTDVLLHPRTYHDESSLGLTGINWSDSFGPFDLGLPTLGKRSSGDSISLTGFFRGTGINVGTKPFFHVSFKEPKHGAPCQSGNSSQANLEPKTCS